MPDSVLEGRDLKKRADYTGEEQQRAVPLKWGELEPGFPAPEYCARLDAIDYCSEDVRQWVADPTLMLLDKDKWPSVAPKAKVNVENDTEWIKIVTAMFQRRLLFGLEEMEVFHVEGCPIFNGAFGFEQNGEGQHW